jgi:hypothetical protein
VVNGKYARSYLVGDILLRIEWGNFLVLQGVLYSLAFNKNIISAPQLMKNQDYIIIVKDNYVELRYKGTSLKMHMKTSENLYIYLLENNNRNMQLNTTKCNSRVSHNNLHENTFYTPNIHNLPYLPSTIVENGRTSGLKYQKVHQITTAVGSNTSTGNCGVVQKIPNNGQVLTTGRSSGHTAKYQKVHQTMSTGGSNTSTKHHGVVPKILNNRQVLTNGTRSRYTANNNKNDNTAYLGNILAPVNQGDISANNGELSAMKKKKTKMMEIN